MAVAAKDDAMFHPPRFDNSTGVFTIAYTPLLGDGGANGSSTTTEVFVCEHGCLTSRCVPIASVSLHTSVLITSAPSMVRKGAIDSVFLLLMLL
jgi:hypothetical protein